MLWQLIQDGPRLWKRVLPVNNASPWDAEPCWLSGAGDEHTGNTRASSTNTAPAPRPLFSSCAGITGYALTVVIEVIEPTVLHRRLVDPLRRSPCHLTPALEAKARMFEFLRRNNRLRKHKYLYALLSKVRAQFGESNIQPFDASSNSVLLVPRSPCVSLKAHPQFHNSS